MGTCKKLLPNYDAKGAHEWKKNRNTHTHLDACTHSFFDYVEPPGRLIDVEIRSTYTPLAMHMCVFKATSIGMYMHV